MSEPPRNPTLSGRQNLVGTVIAGRYEVTHELGAGGMGVVLRARQIAMNREVALKVLHPQFSQNRHAVARFHREMQVTSRLEHPNTIRVYDFGETDDGQLFLAMELVPGKTLSELLGAQPRVSPARDPGPSSDSDHEAIPRQGLPLERLVHIARQIATALKAAHGEGIVHRDLKPDNVMLIDRYGDKDVVKVLDFGIARFADDDDESHRLTAEGAVVGTPAYMSPEQATGHPVGPATDLYAFGVMLFEMATGTIPFSAPTTVSLMVKHVQEAPPRPSDVAPVNPGLEKLILQCLAKDPADRPASAERVLAALDALVAPRASPGALAAETRKSPPADPAYWKGPEADGAPPAPARRSKLPLILALSSLVVIGAVLAIVLTQGSSGSGANAGTTPIAAADTSSPEPTSETDAAAPPPNAPDPADPADTAGPAPEPVEANAADTSEASPTDPDAAQAADPDDDAADPDATQLAAGPDDDATEPTDDAAARLDPDDASPPGDTDPTDATEPRPPDPRIALTAAYAKAGEPEPPEACRATDSSLVPLLVAASEDLARRPLGQGNEQDFKAFEELRAFSGASPELFAGSAEAQAFFARALLRAVSTPSEALEPAKKAVELCPSWALAHNVLGNVQQAMTDYDDARRSYTSASTLLPVWGVPRFNLALVELAARQPAAAIAVLDRLLSDHPDWPNAHLLRAQSRLMAGDAKGYPLAEADALRATELTPTREQAWFMLGEARRAQKLGDAAREAYCKAKELGSAPAANHCK